MTRDPQTQVFFSPQPLLTPTPGKVPNLSPDLSNLPVSSLTPYSPHSSYAELCHSAKPFCCCQICCCLCLEHLSFPLSPPLFGQFFFLNHHLRGAFLEHSPPQLRDRWHPVAPLVPYLPLAANCCCGLLSVPLAGLYHPWDKELFLPC